MIIKKMWEKKVIYIAGTSLFFVLSACSSVDRAVDTKNGINYSNNKSVKTLESPAGIIPPDFDTTFALPEGVVTSKYKQQSTIDLTPPDLTK